MLAVFEQNQGALRTSSPHVDLLLCCARAQLGSPIHDRIRTLVGQVEDWELLLREAGRHRLRPLLYRNLNLVCPEAVPGPVLRRLENDFYGFTARNLFMAGELCRIMNLLQANGLRAATFKGPALAVSALGNIGMREFTDLDVLVQRRDLYTVHALLGSLGYSLTYPWRDRPSVLSLSSQHEYPFVNQDETCRIDLHCQLMPRYFSVPFCTETLLRRAVSECLPAGKVLTFCAEDTLLVLAAHGMMHGWPIFEWVLCVAELMRTKGKEIDYASACAQAHRLGISRIFATSVLLAHNIFGTTPPEPVAAQIKDDAKVELLATEAENGLLCPPRDLAAFVRLPWIHLRARERIVDRIRFCLFGVFAPEMEDTTVIPLPTSLFFLYWLVRPFRILGLYAGAVLRSWWLKIAR